MTYWKKCRINWPKLI